jgi:hypothetical protein
VGRRIVAHGTTAKRASFSTKTNEVLQREELSKKLVGWEGCKCCALIGLSYLELSLNDRKGAVRAHELH